MLYCGLWNMYLCWRPIILSVTNSQQHAGTAILIENRLAWGFKPSSLRSTPSPKTTENPARHHARQKPMQTEGKVPRTHACYNAKRRRRYRSLILMLIRMRPIAWIACRLRVLLLPFYSIVSFSVLRVSLIRFSQAKTQKKNGEDNNNNNIM